MMIVEDSAPLRFRSCEGEGGLLVDRPCCGELAPGVQKSVVNALHCDANLNVRERAGDAVVVVLMTLCPCDAHRWHTRQLR